MKQKPVQWCCLHYSYSGRQFSHKTEELIWKNQLSPLYFETSAVLCGEAQYSIILNNVVVLDILFINIIYVQNWQREFVLYVHHMKYLHP